MSSFVNISETKGQLYILTQSPLPTIVPKSICQKFITKMLSGAEAEEPQRFSDFDRYTDTSENKMKILSQRMKNKIFK